MKELWKALLKSSFCLSFSYHSPLKYIYQVSEKTLFLSTFDFLGFKDSRFQEIKSDTFLCFLELWGLLFITLGKSSNKAPLQQINRIRNPTLIRGRRLLQNFWKTCGAW